MDINIFWNKLKSLEGETFKTVTGLEFTFHFVSDNAICTSRTKYNLTRANFEKALALCPIAQPGDISKIIHGSSYVYSIITDERMQ